AAQFSLLSAVAQERSSVGWVERSELHRSAQRCTDRGGPRFARPTLRALFARSRPAMNWARCTLIGGLLLAVAAGGRAQEPRPARGTILQCIAQRLGGGEPVPPL